MPSAFDEIEIPKKDEPPAATAEPTAEVPAPEPQPQAEQSPPAEPSGAEAQGLTEGEGQQAADDQPDEETARDIEARKGRHGDSWSIKAYRELMDEKRKAKPVLELAQRHGARTVQIGTEVATAFLDLASAQPAELPAKVDALLDQLYATSPKAFNAFRDRFFWDLAQGAPDVTLQGLLKDGSATLKEVQEALAAHRENAQLFGTLDGGDDDLSQLPPALRKEIEESRAMRAKLPDLETKVTGFLSERERQAKESLESEGKAIANDLYNRVWSAVETRVNNLGLEPKSTDTPRVRGIKAALKDKLSKERIEEAFDQTESNLELVKRAHGFAMERKREDAEAYLEPLSIAAGLALEKMLEGEEVKSLLAALKSEMLAQSTPPNPTARPEVVAGAPAPFNAPDPWAEGAKEGKSPWDVSVELAGQRRPAGAAGH
jgi:hypothetical protein